jgi:hypothetical protein
MDPSTPNFSILSPLKLTDESSSHNNTNHQNSPPNARIPISGSRPGHPNPTPRPDAKKKSQSRPQKKTTESDWPVWVSKEFFPNKKYKDKFSHQKSYFQNTPPGPILY